MESANQPLLRKPDVEPTSDVIAEALGAAHTAYAKFLNGLTDHGIQLQWRYYTDGKAWLAKGLHQWTGVRGGQKEVTVFWLSVWDGFFKVTIYIPEKARAAARDLPLDAAVRQMIADSKQMDEKLRYFPIVFEFRSDAQFDAVYTLAEFKKSVK